MFTCKSARDKIRTRARNSDHLLYYNDHFADHNCSYYGALNCPISGVNRSSLKTPGSSSGSSVCARR